MTSPTEENRIMDDILHNVDDDDEWLDDSFIDDSELLDDDDESVNEPTNSNRHTGDLSNNDNELVIIDTIHIQRPSRKINERVMLGYINKTPRVKLTDTTILTVKHLLNYLPFDKKNSPYIIRKGTMMYTLQQLGCKFKKNENISQLLEKLKTVLEYQVHYDFVVKQITRIQRVFPTLMKHIRTNIQGPGIPVSKCINTECPFSLENLSDIDDTKVLTWKDDKIYGCDGEMLIKSIASSVKNRYKQTILRMNPHSPVQGTINPFTRSPLKAELLKRCIRFCEVHNLPPIFRDYEQEKRQETNTRRRNNGFQTGFQTARRLYIRRNHRHIDDDNDSFTSNDSPRMESTQSEPIQSQEQGNETTITTRFERLRAVSHNQFLLLEEPISESLRLLDFYTPINLMSEPMQFIWSLIDTHLSGNLCLENMRSLIVFLNEKMVPMVRYATHAFRQQNIHNYFIRVSRFYQVANTSIYSHIRRGFYLNRIITLHGQLVSMMYIGNEMRETPTEITEELTRLMEAIVNVVLEFWVKFLIIFGGFLVVGADTTLQDEVIIPLEERRSLAILLISILFNGGFLNQEFEWASFS